jgi:prepilin-type N-terminal cleavage/methylation domain-containing protein
MFSVLPDKRKVKRAGFTLIEMLVVMAIFSLIASFVTARTQEVRTDARDTQRKRDLNTLRTAVSIFRDQKDRWPNDLNELKTSDIMNVLPQDPSRDKTYGYSTSSSNADICLVACMEKSNNADSNSVCSTASYSGYISSCDSDKSHYLAL